VTNNFVTTSNFDVGQIQVLRGPQGTLRGEPAPSGSLTITTRRPDLEQFGGYVTVTGTNHDNTNEQGAINLPIIKERLAVRLAGIADDDNYNDVKSVNDPQDPYFHTYGGRVSVRVEPVDSVEANFVYQHLYTHQSSYPQVYGAGAPGGTIVPNPLATGYGVPAVVPANYNGPPISPLQRLGVNTYPDVLYNRDDIGTAQVDWHFLGQTLTYDGSYSRYALRHGGYASVPGNQAPGINAANPVPPIQDEIPYTTGYTQTHELRVSSETPLFSGLMDYTAGMYLRETTNEVNAVQGQSYLSGSFGSPLGAADPFTYNPAYTLQVDVNSPSQERELSEFAHLTFHLPHEIELALGGRHINYQKSGFTEVNYIKQFSIAEPAFAFPAPCAAIGFSSTYPGTCNVPAAAIPTFNGSALPRTPQNLRDSPWIYNFSLSHKINPDLLVYVSSGSSWRPPAQSVGIYNAANDPTLNSLLHLQTETSYEFEGGFKWSFLERRGRLNITYYHQKFNGFIYEGLQTIYLQDNGVQSTVMPFAFNSNPDAVVNGVDFDSGFQITRQWNVGLNASLANGHLTGSSIPCNPPSGGTTAAAFAAPPYIFLCPSHASTSTTANFNASAQSEYDLPLPFAHNIDSFIRGLYVFNGRNPHASEFYVTPSYGIMNLYLGVRSPDGAWEASLFAKNLFNTQRILQVSYPEISTGLTGLFGSSGYSYVGGSPNGGGGITPQQEFGLTLTYSIGSR
jgi:iron complex outermembrane receptor protein